MDNINGYWPNELYQDGTFIVKDRRIQIDAITNEIILPADYRRSEIDYVLQQVKMP